MSSLMGLEPCGFLYMAVCVCAHVYMYQLHACMHTQVSPTQGMANISMHIHLMCIFHLLSHFFCLLFFLCISLWHTHMYTLTRAQCKCRCCHAPGVQASSAWYPANSFIGPGVQLYDHNVMWILISAYVVQFEKEDAIPIPVITLISSYCTEHVYHPNIKLYGP